MSCRCIRGLSEKQMSTLERRRAYGLKDATLPFQQEMKKPCQRLNKLVFEHECRENVTNGPQGPLCRLSLIGAYHQVRCRCAGYNKHEITQTGVELLLAISVTSNFA
ncbi:hypothetical protein TNCV_4844741 [Trichonephila clavipes]|uniref:Uncharacterized protein n=1 Tax=Trichonephila clavipes TaxID=2585209 RepID=A0A8X6WKD0_TRICX|nr:hypothetical protein TNCV_4844741 [Trichonephila clavipes]